MKLLHGNSIKDALRGINPTHIAVAYVGIDWSTYISVNNLREIVLSPTVGSNPSAIVDIAEAIGWENVHFLDYLHSKIYIGATAAAVGSFNLTANGLSAEGLEEAGFLMFDLRTITQLHELFEFYKAEAIKAYPTIEDKISRIGELRALWDRGIKNGLFRNDATPTDLKTRLPTARDEIYVCWSWGGMEHSSQVISPETINNSLAFAHEDKILPDRWLLVWQCRNDGYPDDRFKPYWLHIDEVLENGAVHDHYTKLVIERNDRSPLPPPFELTESVISALRAVLRSDAFPEFLGNVHPWSLNPTIGKLPLFFQAVQRLLRAPARSTALVEPEIDALRAEFARRIREAMGISIQRRYVTSQIDGMLASRHPVEIAKRFVRPDGLEIRNGLVELARANALELSFESIMREEQFRPLFTQHELDGAAWNLDEAKRSIKRRR